MFLKLYEFAVRLQRKNHTNYQISMNKSIAVDKPIFMIIFVYYAMPIISEFKKLKINYTKEIVALYFMFFII